MFIALLRLYTILLIFNLFIMKSIALAIDYNKLERQWGTYYGGNDEETDKSKDFEIDSDGSVIVAGGTKSNTFWIILIYIVNLQ